WFEGVARSEKLWANLTQFPLDLNK
ncbi:MAG: hypothetical protein RL553_2301, partial [Planctomycetota bacterium]